MINGLGCEKLHFKAMNLSLKSFAPPAETLYQIANSSPNSPSFQDATGRANSCRSIVLTRHLIDLPLHFIHASMKPLHLLVQLVHGVGLMILPLSALDFTHQVVAAALQIAGHFANIGLVQQLSRFPHMPGGGVDYLNPLPHDGLPVLLVLLVPPTLLFGVLAVFVSISVCVMLTMLTVAMPITLSLTALLVAVGITVTFFLSTSLLVPFGLMDEFFGPRPSLFSDLTHFGCLAFLSIFREFPSPSEIHFA